MFTTILAVVLIGVGVVGLVEMARDAAKAVRKARRISRSIKGYAV